MKKRRQKREGNDLYVAHSLTLCFTPIFILNFLSADYLISNIKHFIKKKIKKRREATYYLVKDGKSLNGE